MRSTRFSVRVSRPARIAVSAVALAVGIAPVAVRAADDAKVAAPAGAMVVFDGKDLSKWEARGGGEAKFKVADGAMTAAGGDIETKEKFRDFKLHIEFAPNDVGPEKHGQERGNSGIYLQSRYEIQVLDSYGIEKLSSGDCASIYSQKAPDKNMSKKPGEWQSYDITFHAAVFEGDKKVKPAVVTIVWNGETVQDNVEIKGSTGAGDKETADPGPIRLQFHGNPVKFRNVSITPLDGEKK